MACVFAECCYRRIAGCALRREGDGDKEGDGESKTGDRTLG